MKKFISLILFLFLICSGRCWAAQYNVLVLPTSIFEEYTDYMVFPKSADIIAMDIVNIYNSHPQMSAVQLYQIKNALNQPANKYFKREVVKMLHNYDVNYSIDFNTVQKLASRFKTKQVLLISCQMDTQNYITRRTLWDFLNIPGATVIDPAYRLTSQITLIDANNQIILWQENYHKLISSRENRIMTQAYSPSSEQLEKVKRYSTKFLSPQVVQETQLALMKIDQYQDLNLRPNIVKPTAISIDKFKIDGRRASVRSTRYVKAETKKAARNLAKETKALNAKAKANIKEFQNTQAEKQMLKAKEDALPLEDKIKKAQDEQRAKLEAKYEKERIRLEKKQEREQIKAAKKAVTVQMQEEHAQKQVQKIQVQTQEQVKTKEVKKNIQPINQEKVQKQKDKKPNKTKNAKVDIEVKEVIQNTPNISTPVDVIKNEQKLVPIIRTKPILREIDYTINDI